MTNRKDMIDEVRRGLRDPLRSVYSIGALGSLVFRVFPILAFTSPDDLVRHTKIVLHSGEGP
jgi:hypothetical protein